MAARSMLYPLNGYSMASSARTSVLEVGEVAKLACAVGERLGRYPHLVHHRHVEVGERGFLQICHVPAQVEQSVAASGDHRRQIVMVVITAEAAAVTHHDVIEQRPVAVLGGLQLVDEVAELIDLEAIDLDALLDLFLVARMVRQAV